MWVSPFLWLNRSTLSSHRFARNRNRLDLDRLGDTIRSTRRRGFILLTLTFYLLCSSSFHHLPYISSILFLSSFLSFWFHSNSWIPAQILDQSRLRTATAGANLMGADLYKKITDYFIRHLAGVRRVSFKGLTCHLVIDDCWNGIMRSKSQERRRMMLRQVEDDIVLLSSWWSESSLRDLLWTSL